MLLCRCRQCAEGAVLLCCCAVAGNVLKELCYPAGAMIRVSAFELGDPTLSVLEVWGAEYQESNALLVRADDRRRLEHIGEREKCPVSFVGLITGDGKVLSLLITRAARKSQSQ